jgi:glycerol-3-phosphate dehydrogenase
MSSSPRVRDAQPSDDHRAGTRVPGAGHTVAGGFASLASSRFTGEPPRERARALATLANQHFDLLVVGGGATGAGVVRDAATRGLRVAGVEAQDFASGTSSHSSKLIHGGLRYLQYLDFGLVFEALRERQRLMRTAPHLCQPLGFVFPSYRGLAPGLNTLGAGIALYNALALWRSPLSSRRLTPAETLALAPGLRDAGLEGAHLYGDCQTNDARLVLETVLDAQAAGATVLPRLRVIRLLRDRRGRVRGALGRDRLSGVEIEIRATVVVNATGPFSDAFDRGRRNLRPTLGVHIVLDAQRLPHHGRALVLRSPRDGRLVFMLPHGPRTIVGTTDTEWQPAAASGAAAASTAAGSSSPTVQPPGGSTAVDPTPPRVEDPIAARFSDVDYLLEVANHAFPAAALGPDQVVSTFAGLRPLVAAPAVDASSTSREHEIAVEGDGLVTIVGGKLTTYRQMAEEVTDLVVERLRLSGHEGAIGPCVTATRPLPGGRPPGRGAAPAQPSEHDREPPPDARSPWTEDDRSSSTSSATTGGARLGRIELSPDIEAHLVETYGSRAAAVVETMNATVGGVDLSRRLYPDLPYVWAELAYGARHELALDIEDLLRRRTSIFRDAHDQGLGVAAETAGVLGATLGWSGAEQARAVEDYARVVAESTAWKQGAPAGASDAPTPHAAGRTTSP